MNISIYGSSVDDARVCWRAGLVPPWRPFSTCRLGSSRDGFAAFGKSIVRYRTILKGGDNLQFAPVASMWLRSAER